MSNARLFSVFKHFDWLVFLAVSLLVLFGLVALYSIIQSQDQPSYIVLEKQLVSVVIGLVLLLALSLMDYRELSRWAKPAYLLAILLLLSVLIFGRTIRGTRGWLVVGGWQWQVVEAVKFLLIIWLADFLAKNARGFTFNKIIQSGLLVLVLFSLVLGQPDFGSAAVLFFLWLVGLVFGRAKLAHVGMIFIIILVVATVGWFFLFKDYQKERVMTFVNPSLDPYGRGYNVMQAKIAVGAGNLFGRGLGAGTQSQLRFIPEAQTDFIFAVVAEELGLVGVGLILGFFGLLFWRMILLAQQARDDFGVYLVLLILSLLFIHVFVNIGMNIGLLPVAGISLPFLSSGGSFLTICLALVGVVESVGRQSRQIRYL